MLRYKPENIIALSVVESIEKMNHKSKNITLKTISEHVFTP